MKQLFWRMLALILYCHPLSYFAVLLECSAFTGVIAPGDFRPKDRFMLMGPHTAVMCSDQIFLNYKINM